MIFVTIGQTYGFDRLIRQMDEIAGRLSEEIVMQIGSGCYEPKNAKYARYMLRDEIEQFYKTSRLVISHAGAGSILSILNFNNNLLLIPRMKIYQEAVDDHQLQIASELEKEGIVRVVYDINDLEHEIKDTNMNPKKFNLENSLSDKLKIYLDHLVFNEVTNK